MNVNNTQQPKKKKEERLKAILCMWHLIIQNVAEKPVEFFKALHCESTLSEFRKTNDKLSC